MAGYFITGTGTDIGKTWLACALLAHWRGEGLATHAVKPVMSGVDDDNLAASDAGQLLIAQEQPVAEAAVAAIAPWRFAPPLSPDMAARREGREIDIDALVAFTTDALCRPATTVVSESAAPTLVEGVGGVMVPLDARHTVLDWIAASGLPAVLVAGSYLGSMSHTLTALAALRGRGVPVTAVAVNETPGSAVPLAETLASLAAHVEAAAGGPVVGIARAEAGEGVAALARILRAS